MSEAGGTLSGLSELPTPISAGSDPACPSEVAGLWLWEPFSLILQPKSASFYRKGAVVEEPCCFPHPSLTGREVLQLPEPKCPQVGPGKVQIEY